MFWNFFADALYCAALHRQKAAQANAHRHGNNANRGEQRHRRNGQPRKEHLVRELHHKQERDYHEKGELRRGADGLYPEGKYQREGGHEQDCGKRAEDRSERLRRCNCRMCEPVCELDQQGKRHREGQYGKEFAPKEVCGRYRGKLQEFEGIAFALPRKAVRGERRPHRGHEATEQEHHVAFHAVKDLRPIARRSNRLARRQNHRRDDERDPETRFPKNQAKFVSKDVKHLFLLVIPALCRDHRFSVH